MKIVLIEDEFPALERLEKLVRKVAPDLRIEACLQSVEESLRWFGSHAAPDLVLSDIQLSDGLSFEIFEQLSASVPIIFITSYDEYALKAFKLNSIDYLLKPLKTDELQTAIEKFKGMQPASMPDYVKRLQTAIAQLQSPHTPYKSRLLVKQGEQLLPISQAEIAYFFTANEMTCLIRNDGKQFVIDYTLEEMEKQLPPQRFFRLNRQFLASASCISQIYPFFNGRLKLELRPASAQEVFVSREKASAFKDWLEGA
jgi:DNA-binding LytR/AlgR family response regulator